MIDALPQRLRTLWLLVACAALAACQSMPPPTGFSPAQVAVLQSQGFVETTDGWQLTLPERLLFPTNESALQPGQDMLLINVARNLVSAGVLSARVEGHTDSTGTSAYNLTLSQARAEAVAEPLRANGMRFGPGQVVGRGEMMPLSSNDTPEGRQDNRRVVVIVTPE